MFAPKVTAPHLDSTVFLRWLDQAVKGESAVIFAVELYAGENEAEPRVERDCL